ncbi:MAG: hypothetical protein ACKE5Q_07310 [Methylophilaceae bacterium]
MSESELIPNSIILGEREYTGALDLVIAEAQQQLLIFDQDFSTGDYASVKRVDAIYAFLNNNPTSELTIVLQESDYFTTQCPRLFELLIIFSHKMTVYETNNHAKIAKDCFILADSKSYIRRFHIDQARFKFSLEDIETTASLTNRFEELMQETTHKVSPNKLGL